MKTRIERIEMHLTPKQAVLLWLREEHQPNTSSSYMKMAIDQPSRARARTRLSLQVATNIRAAMKGMDSFQIDSAVRQGQMQADFLILLVSETNKVIFDESRCRWLEIALLKEQLRNATLENKGSRLEEWIAHVRESASNLLALQKASELLSNHHLCGEDMLFKDLREELETQIAHIKQLMDIYDHVAVEMGRPSMVTSVKSFEERVRSLAQQRADTISALAEVKILDDFNEEDAADQICKQLLADGSTANVR
jgi:hypothetical protein